MSTQFDPETLPSADRVHLEKCKICGEWINRLSLDEVVLHLDHSRHPSPLVQPADSQNLADV
jgi:hypothetical protein